MTDWHAPFYAISAALTFSYASVGLRQYSDRFGAYWMNAYKAYIALIAFFIFILINNEWISFVENLQAGPSLYLFASGFIGLGVGDFFLLRAFSKIGATRSLTIFQCQPVMMIVLGYLFFQQTITGIQAIGILVLISAVLILCQESAKKTGSWKDTGVFYALLGTGIDAIGVIMSRQAFEVLESLSVGQANMIRFMGACIAFTIFSFIWPLNTFKKLKSLSKKEGLHVSFVGLMATFVALFFWIKAISEGNLAITVALVGMGPIFAALFESWAYKTWPTRSLWWALILCVAGMVLGI